MVLLRPGRSVGEAEEVRLVDGVQHLHHRALDDLVLQRGDAERPLPAVGLGMNCRRTASPGSAPLYASMQIDEVGLEIRLVLVPVMPSTPGAARRFNCETQSAAVDVHMVQERRQPNPFIPPCGATYALPCLDTLAQLWSGACCSDRIALAPPLPSTASAQRALFGGFPGTMASSTSPAVHHRLAIALPMRPPATSPTPAGDLPFPCNASTRAESYTTQASALAVRTTPCCLPLLSTASAPMKTFRAHAPPASSPSTLRHPHTPTHTCHRTASLRRTELHRYHLPPPRRKFENCKCA